MPLLEVQNLIKDFPSVRALDSISLKVDEGQIIGIIGEKDSGKRTLTSIIAGSLQPNEGRILFGNQDVTTKTIRERIGLGLVSSVRQTNLFQKLLDSKFSPSLGQVLYRESAPFNRRLSRRLTRQEKREIVDKVLGQLGLGYYYRDLRLSGGERNLFSIAICLVRDPKLVVIDAPFEGLSYSGIDRVEEFFEELRCEHGISFVITEDSPRVKFNYDYVYLLRHGKVIAAAQADEIQNYDKTLYFSDSSQSELSNKLGEVLVSIQAMADQPKYNFPNAHKVQIFEQVETYIENNNAVDRDIKESLNDLQQVVSDLQRRYPQVTEEEATTIIEAEFEEIKLTQPQRWRNLLSLKPLWNGLKKGSLNIGEHFAEETPWGKGVIGFLEGITDDE